MESLAGLGRGVLGRAKPHVDNSSMGDALRARDELAGIFTDIPSRLWQQGGPVWLRIALGGEAREVRMPERFDPYRFKLDRIWGVRRNELDVASVAWIAVLRER